MEEHEMIPEIPAAAIGLARQLGLVNEDNSMSMLGSGVAGAGLGALGMAGLGGIGRLMSRSGKAAKAAPLMMLLEEAAGAAPQGADELMAGAGIGPTSVRQFEDDALAALLGPRQAEVAAAPVPVGGNLEDEIEKWVLANQGGSADPMRTIGELRSAVGGVPRGEFEDTLRKMFRERRVALDPYTQSLALAPDDAVFIENEVRNFVRPGEKIRRSASTVQQSPPVGPTLKERIVEKVAAGEKGASAGGIVQSAAKKFEQAVDVVADRNVSHEVYQKAVDDTIDFLKSYKVSELKEIGKEIGIYSYKTKKEFLERAAAKLRDLRITVTKRRMYGELGGPSQSQ